MAKKCYTTEVIALRIPFEFKALNSYSDAIDLLIVPIPKEEIINGSVV